MCEHHANAGLVLSEKQCEHCGGEIWTKPTKAGKARKKRFCSKVCSGASRGYHYSGKTREQLRQESIKRRTFTCKCCSKVYVAKTIARNQYCSRDCAYLDQKAWQKGGLTKSQKEKYWGEYTKVCFDYTLIELKTCPICGTKHYKRQSGSDYCSKACQTKKDSIKLAVSLGVAVGKTKQCKYCNSQFVVEYGSKRRVFCSEGCSKAFSRKRKLFKNHKKRADHYGVLYEPVNPIDVFNRDDWTCKACGCETPKELRGKNQDDSPELDHVVAISQGGNHTIDNCQTLCRVCNILKSDKPMQVFLDQMGRAV